MQGVLCFNNWKYGYYSGRSEWRLEEWFHLVQAAKRIVDELLSYILKLWCKLKFNKSETGLL